MNPNLTANLRAQRELQAEISKEQLQQVEQALATALPWLENARCLMQANRLDTAYSGLFQAVCDAITATQEACDRVADSPDDDRPGAMVVRPKEPELIRVVDGELDASSTEFDTSCPCSLS